MERILNDQAQVAGNWYSDNKLLANKEKFQAMVITKKIGQDLPKIHLEVNEEIEQMTCLKLLGVTTDHQLSFSEHVKHISDKSSQKIGVLLRMKNLIPEKAKLHIFKTNILPHLTHCSMVWHFIRSSDKRKLERLQEKRLRAFFKDKSSSYEDFLKLTLNNQRLRNIAILMVKVKHGICPTYISDLFNLQTTQYNLRNSEFVIPRFNTVTYGKHSISILEPPTSGHKECKHPESVLLGQMNLSNLISNECGPDCFLCSS